MTGRAIRPHAKSRTGCATCKRRKIKCDEEYPMCGNCTKRKVDCTWAPKTFRFVNSSPETRVSPASISTALSRRRPKEISILSTFQHPDASFVLSSRTLELMYHYTSMTCYTLTFVNETNLDSVWNTAVPRLSFTANGSHLLHAILAVTALHLHSLDPTSPSAGRYSYAATVHCNAALAGLTIPSFDSANLIPFVLTLSVIVIYGFAISPPSLTSSNSRFRNWLRVLRVLTKTCQQWPALPQGVTGPLASRFPVSPSALLSALPDPESGDTFPQFLSTLPFPTPGAPDPEEVADEEVSADYQWALALLQLAWKASFIPRYQGYALLAWFAGVSDRFLTFLFERRPRALLLTVHYCVIMQSMERKNTDPNCPSSWWAQRKNKWDDIITELMSQVGPQWTEWVRRNV
ncbi:hypothetical protein ARMSODRAFT_1018727 [Armillaria solidipes]|uniref:Zn(2)-C6 fungal-type domain-containing protein n=1 Tax=Armillaria solidipes TaxID=1076256 RepID=A0A2H3BXI8_9AGAR|nr:hypothetical protein ARMSODRAFT_1018727 [Armillaria solidipes]